MSDIDSAERNEVINVTPDSGVTKTVLREGTGETPPLHARCLVHYVGKLAGTDEVIMDTRSETSGQEPVQVVAGRDATMREAGVHLAVATMRKGELCQLRVTPKYGYGEKGSFSFPTVPPNAELEYEVELLDWEPVDEGRETRTMTYEERLEAAQRRRQDGNQLFKEGQYEEALSKYRLALSFLNEDLLLQLEGFHLDKAQAVRAPALANMAACQLRLQDYSAAIISCNEALGAEPGNAKALFRRGRARHLLGQTEAALQDLQQARKAAPSDAGILQELQAVKAELREERKAQGQIFKGYFDKAGGGALYEDSSPPGTPQKDAGGSGGSGVDSGDDSDSSDSGRADSDRGGGGRGGISGAGPVAAQLSAGWWEAMLGWLLRGLQALFPAWFPAKAHAA